MTGKWWIGGSGKKWLRPNWCTIQALAWCDWGKLQYSMPQPRFEAGTSHMKNSLMLATCLCRSVNTDKCWLIYTLFILSGFSIFLGDHLINYKATSWNEKNIILLYCVKNAYIYCVKNIQPIFINLTDAYFRTLISTKQTNLWGENHSVNVTSQCKLSERPIYPVVIFPVKTAFHNTQIPQAWTREVRCGCGDFTA